MIAKGVLEELSPLEAEVLKALLPGRKMKVRDVHASVSKRQKVVLTSVAVMLDRLHGKRLVDREIETCRGGTRYIYFLRKSPAEIEEEYLKGQVDGIISKFGDKAIAYFHKRFSEGKA
ncbi:MAG: BlaI/MecI/CopY family transcriptional regulator [Candidatus Micrarchaeota archaeon]